MNKDTLSSPPGGDKPTITASSKNNNNNTNSNKHNHARYNNRDRPGNGPTRGKPRDSRETKENNTLRYKLSYTLHTKQYLKK